MALPRMTSGGAGGSTGYKPPASTATKSPVTPIKKASTPAGSYVGSGSSADVANGDKVYKVQNPDGSFTNNVYNASGGLVASYKHPAASTPTVSTTPHPAVMNGGGYDTTSTGNGANAVHSTTPVVQQASPLGWMPQATGTGNRIVTPTTPTTPTGTATPSPYQAPSHVGATMTMGDGQKYDPTSHIATGPVNVHPTYGVGGAVMNNGGYDTTSTGNGVGPVHTSVGGSTGVASSTNPTGLSSKPIVQPSAPATNPYHAQSTGNSSPAGGYVPLTGNTPPPSTGTTHTGGSAPSGGSTVPPTGTTTPPVTGTTPPAGTGTGASGASVPPFEAGSGTYNPNGVNQLAQDALGALNTSGQQSQWQTMAQQDAAASYIQQETAWQTYINQLMSQMGLTDKGYQDQLNQSLNTLNDKSFQDYLQSRQDMADRGLANSGLNAAQNTQLALAQQQQIGALQQQMNQQKYANDTNYGQQVNQVNSQMDTLDPQSLYNQYYQTMQQSGQQAAQQQFNDYMQMIQQYGPYLSPTADQYGQLSNTYNKNLQDYLIGQQNANTNQFTAQADANYKAGQLGVAQGQLALKASDTAVQEQQKWAQIANQQQSLDTQASHYAAQDANSARSTTALQITKAMDNLTTQMDNALTNNKPDQYNQLYAQWQGLQQSLKNVTMGAVGGSSGN